MSWARPQREREMERSSEAEIPAETGERCGDWSLHLLYHWHGVLTNQRPGMAELGPIRGRQRETAASSDPLYDEESPIPRETEAATAGDTGQ